MQPVRRQDDQPCEPACLDLRQRFCSLRPLPCNTQGRRFHTNRLPRPPVLTATSVFVPHADVVGLLYSLCRVEHPSHQAYLLTLNIVAWAQLTDNLKLFFEVKGPVYGKPSSRVRIS